SPSSTLTEITPSLDVAMAVALRNSLIASSTYWARYRACRPNRSTTACAMVRLLRTPTSRSRFGVNDGREGIARPGTCWTRPEATRPPRRPEPSFGATSVVVDSYTFGISFDIPKASTEETTHRIEVTNRQRQTIRTQSTGVNSSSLGAASALGESGSR